VASFWDALWGRSAGNTAGSPRFIRGLFEAFHAKARLANPKSGRRATASAQNSEAAPTPLKKPPANLKQESRAARVELQPVQTLSSIGYTCRVTPAINIR
jgi:hypothetical protein